MTAADPILTSLMDAVAAGQAGDRALARQCLDDLWRGIGTTGDPGHRCILAHYLADLQETPEAELLWDQRAMAAAEDLTDERLQRIHPALTVRGFLPSLNLNLADGHRRLGQFEQARSYLTAAAEGASNLPDDGYGRHLRDAVRHVRQALDDASTERLDTHPGPR